MFQLAMHSLVLNLVSLTFRSLAPLCHVLSPETVVEWCMALCVTAHSPSSSFSFSSALPSSFQDPGSIYRWEMQQPLWVWPPRVRHSLPFRAGVETSNTRQILQSLPIYLEKAFYVHPLRCQVAHVHQRGQLLAVVSGAAFCR